MNCQLLTLRPVSLRFFRLVLRRHDSVPQVHPIYPVHLLIEDAAWTGKTFHLLAQRHDFNDLDDFPIMWMVLFELFRFVYCLPEAVDKGVPPSARSASSSSFDSRFGFKLLMIFSISAPTSVSSLAKSARLAKLSLRPFSSSRL